MHARKGVLKPAFMWLCNCCLQIREVMIQGTVKTVHFRSILSVEQGMIAEWASNKGVP